MFDPKAVARTNKISKEKPGVTCFLITQGTGSEMFRFLLPVVASTEEWTNNLNETSPYKRYTLLDFQSRGSEKLSFDAVLTTNSRSRSIQPLLDRLKSCMMPQSLGTKKDDVNPPLLSLVIGELRYKNLYLTSVRINTTERQNGLPIFANVSLSFVSSYIEVR